MPNLAELIEQFPDARKHLLQYTGVWAMEPQALEAAAQHAESIDLVAHIKAERERLSEEEKEARESYHVTEDGIAWIDIVGSMTKYGSSLATYAGNVRTRNAIRSAVANSAVRGIFLRIDSPGGSTAGVEDLAADVREAARSKPIHAYIEDIGASAAYWVGSQAERLTAGPGALVGSIGTYGVLRDSSGLAKATGVKVHVVSAGDFKGAGVPGTEITAEHLADFERTVNEINDSFVESVSEGRKLGQRQARALADGRVHKGENARVLGLVDAVETIDAAMVALVERVNSAAETPSETEAQKMADNKEAATFAELRAAMPNAAGDFIISALEQGLTVEAAKDRLIEQQQLQIQERTRERDEERAKASKPGNEPLTDEGSNQGASASTAKETLEQKVAERMKLTGSDRAKATADVLRADSDLREQLVAEANPNQA